MADASADRANVVRSLGIWGVALVAGIVVAVVVGRLFGLGSAPGLIFGALVFVVLPYLIPTKGATAVAPPAHAPARPEPHNRAVPPPQDAAEPVAPPRLAEVPAGRPEAGPEPVPADVPPGAAISERVREAARAAGEAARGLSDGGSPAASRPPALAAARDGAPDNLKRIKGVGPAIETVLHGLGVYHLDQIAAWGPAEVAWMDANLEGFPGRVTRDAWVEQAARLAGGEDTEFSRRVDKGEVY